MKAIILQGSARIDGNTAKVSKILQEKLNCDLVNLASLDIGHFDYNYKNEGDDFYPLIKKIIENYDLIIFASPIYWYTMSGYTKVFFDRISDLIRVHKDMGRQLRNKSMAALSCGYSDNKIESFFTPFEKSADYLGMRYLGDVHTWVQTEQVDKEVIQKIENFAKKIIKEYNA